MSEQIYCIHCGTALPAGTETCTHCHRKPYAKNSPFREFLLRHTKDKLKGTVEDKIYDTLKNYLLSHLYGMLVTLSIGAVVISAAATQPAPKVEKLTDRPAAVEEILQAAVEVPVPVETTEAPTEETTEAPTEPEPTLPQPIDYDFDTQAEVMLANYSLWELPVDYATYASYFVTDLDQDGLLEINSMATMGTGIFTSTVTYEVNETMDGLVLISEPTDNDPEMFCTAESVRWDLTNECVGYYHPETGVYSFLVRDSWRSGVAGNGAVYSVMTMIDNQITRQPLGEYVYSFDMATQKESMYYTLDGVTFDSDEAFHEALCAKFADCVQFIYSDTSLSTYEITDLYAQIHDLVAGYYLTMGE